MKRLSWLLAAPLLVGCSQIDALAPVSGVPLSTVQIAANDVLMRKNVPLLTAPICTPADPGFACSGTTLDGEPIAVSVPNDDMIITVAGKKIFEGRVQDVIEQAGQGR